MPLGLALLVSTDPDTIEQFRRALQEWSISLDVCQEVSATDSLLNQQKFDAVIVDRQLGERSGMILDGVRHSPSNSTAVTFAISANDAACASSGARSEFVFERPLSTQSIHKVRKPAYGLILRERRRYFRCPISVPVVIRSAETRVNCDSINISEGGMALRTSFPFKPAENVRIQFTFPGKEDSFSAELTICWQKSGQIGVRFVSLSQEEHLPLQEWLSQQLEDMIPEVVASKFRGT
jgi:c-di-GMP-binding flagellar brake protein YcgR